MIFGLLSFGLILGTPAVSVQAAGPEPDPAAALLSTGKVGPGAIDVKISAERQAAGEGQEKDHTVVRLQVPKKVYVSAAYISPSGEVTVVFPSKEAPESVLEPGKEYTLFGTGSSLRIKHVGKPEEKAKLVFFVSSKPLSLDPLKVPEDKPFLSIPQTDEALMKILTKKIEELSKTKGFNRKVIALDPGAKLSVRMDLMGLPKAIKGRKPTDVLGVQGEKDEAPTGEDTRR